jgi:hypothetical protein
VNPRWIIAAVAAAILLFLGLGLALPDQPRAPPTFTVAGLAVEGEVLVVRYKTNFAQGTTGTWDPDAIGRNVARLVRLEAGKWTWTVYIPELRDTTPPPPPPPIKLIEAFTVSPETIKKGQSAKLAWSCPKARNVTINGVAVPVTGNQSVSPQATATYTLIAQAEGLQTETAQRILVVSDLPPPDTKWQVMIVTETSQLDNLPKGQQALISGLVFRDALKAKGHKWLPSPDQDALKVAPERWKPWIEAAEGKPRPTLLLAPVTGGDIRAFPLPADEAAMWKMLGEQAK